MTDTIAEVLTAAERLCDLVRSADLIVGFDEEGNGPIRCIADDAFQGDGPILRAADRLRQRLLDHAAIARAAAK